MTPEQLRIYHEIAKSLNGRCKPDCPLCAEATA